MNVAKADSRVCWLLLASILLLLLVAHAAMAADQVPPPLAGAVTPRQAPGRAATPEEAAALDKVVDLFVDAVHQQRYLAAWELLTNTPDGWDCHTWSEKLVPPADPGQTVDNESDAAVLLLASERRLVQVKTFGETGAALFVADFDAPISLSLVLREGAWQIDWNASQDLAATSAINGLSAELKNIRLDNLIKIVCDLAVGDFSRLYWAALTNKEGVTSRKTVARNVDGEGRAVVSLQTRAEANLVVPLKLEALGWVVDTAGKCHHVPAGYQLSKADAPPVTPPAAADAPKAGEDPAVPAK